MLGLPKYGTVESSLATDIHACLLDNHGEPENVLVFLDQGEDGVVFDRQRQSYAYICVVDDCSVRVPECFLGDAEEVNSVILRLNGSAADPALRAMLLAGVPKRPKNKFGILSTVAPAPGLPAAEGATPDKFRDGQVPDLTGAVSHHDATAAAGQNHATEQATDQLSSQKLVEATQRALSACLLEFLNGAKVICKENQREPAPDKLLAMSVATQNLVSDITEDLLGLKNTKIFWERVFGQFIMLGLEMATGNDADSVGARPCHMAVEALQSVPETVSGPGLLLAQIKKLQQILPGFWTKVADIMFLHQQHDTQMRSTQALTAVAAAAAASLNKRPVLGFGGRPGMSSDHMTMVSGVSAALAAVDDVWREKRPTERGCKWWSGIDGSCRTGQECPDVASHVIGQPSLWYTARARVWELHGGVKDDKGNYRIYKPGMKRPAANDGAAESSMSSFRR